MEGIANMITTKARTADSSELPSTVAKPAPKKPGYRTQAEAKNAAVFELGEFARHGFEYETIKCDGRWHFKKCDEVKPPTAADLKASGGKKAPKAEAVARGMSLTALAMALETGAPMPELEIVASPAEQVKAAEATGDVPAFLQRKSTPAEKEAVREKMAKTVGPGRAIKNPPDAKVAKKKAEKRAAGSKTALIGSMLLDPKGCTTAEVLKATGWPAVGMPAQAKACGLKLRKEKDGKVTRYFGSKV